MAIILHKKGKTERFPADQLHSAIAAGWTVEPEPENEEQPQTETAPEHTHATVPAYTPAQVEQEPETQESDTHPQPKPDIEHQEQTKPETETETETKKEEIEPGSVPLTNEQIREEARLKGIPEWSTARIRTLKQQLGIN